MPKVTHSWSRAGNPDALTISSPLQSRVLPQGQTLLQILLSLAVPCSMRDAKKSSVIVWQQTSLAELRGWRCVRICECENAQKHQGAQAPSGKHCKCTAYHIYIEQESARESTWPYTQKHSDGREHTRVLFYAHALHIHIHSCCLSKHKGTL